MMCLAALHAAEWLTSCCRPQGLASADCGGSSRKRQVQAAASKIRASRAAKASHVVLVLSRRGVRTEHPDVSCTGSDTASGAALCPGGQGNFVLSLRGGRHQATPAPTVPVSHSFRHPPAC